MKNHSPRTNHMWEWISWCFVGDGAFSFLFTYIFVDVVCTHSNAHACTHLLVAHTLMCKYFWSTQATRLAYKNIMCKRARRTHTQVVWGIYRHCLNPKQIIKLPILALKYVKISKVVRKWSNPRKLVENHNFKILN